MRNLFKILCVFVFIFVFVTNSLAGKTAQNSFYYNSGNTTNRYYLYQVDGQNVLDYYQEIVSADQPSLKELTNDLHYFLSPVNLWESKKFFFLTNSQLLGHLFDKDSLFQYREYVIRQLNPDFLKLTLADGTKDILTRADQKLSVWTTTSNIATIKTVAVPNRFQLQYTYSRMILPNPEYKVSEMGPFDIIVSENITLSVPKHTIAAWEGTLGTQNMVILQTNTGEYYTFTREDDTFNYTSQYKVLRVGPDNVLTADYCYIKPGRTMYTFTPISKESLVDYYFLMQNNTQKPKDISDLSLIRLAFPSNAKYPLVISDIFYPSGMVSPQDAILARENAGKQLRLNTGLGALNKYAYGILSLKNSAFPHPLRTDGHIADNKYYPKEINYQDRRFAFFIPASFNENMEIYYLVYLHGLHNNISNVLNTDNLIQQISDSGKYIVLFFPELAKDASYPFVGWLEEPNGFTKMLSEIKISLAASLQLDITALNKGKVIIAASGSGQSPLAGILMHGGERVSQAYLFDGLSSGQENLLFWQGQHPGSKLAILFTDNGGAADNVNDLIRTVKGFNLTDNIIKFELPSLREDIVVPDISDKRIIIIDTGKTSTGKLVSKGYLKLLLEKLVPPSAE
ncbi:MAG: hypothetical protein ABIH39_07000 [Candidatus Margulisiibacteriota bacterium]